NPAEMPGLAQTMEAALPKTALSQTPEPGQRRTFRSHLLKHALRYSEVHMLTLLARGELESLRFDDRRQSSAQVTQLADEAVIVAIGTGIDRVGARREV